MTPLCKLSTKYDTDRGGDHMPYGDPNHVNHPYTPIYYDLFKDLVDRPLQLLEIGVSEGRGIRMWREFFSRATIYGWDISIERFEGKIPPGVRLSRVDQSSVASLLGAYNAAGAPGDPPRFDIIIDDGSHHLRDQVTTFDVLWSKLARGGYFIIEDETSPLDAAVTMPPGWTYKLHRWPDPRNMLQVMHYVDTDLRHQS